MGWLANRRIKQEAAKQEAEAIRQRQFDAWQAGSDCGLTVSLDDLYSLDEVATLDEVASYANLSVAWSMPFSGWNSSDVAYSKGMNLQAAFTVYSGNIASFANLHGQDSPVFSDFHPFHRACCSGILYGCVFPGEYADSMIFRNIRHRPGHEQESPEVQLINYATETVLADEVLKHYPSRECQLAAIGIARREFRRNFKRKSGIAPRDDAAFDTGHLGPFMFGVAVSELIRTPRITRLSVSR
jgi:hypothetical protein